MEFASKPRVESGTVGAAPGAGRSAVRESLRGQPYEAQQLQLKPQLQKRETSMMQDIALAQNPNDREQAILENDRDAASAWVQAAAWAVGISTTYAHTTGDADGSMYLGKADALRHCLWNGYMAFMLGEERAKALADAHELPRPPSERQTALDRQMDLHNNAQGRILGVTARNSGAITRAFALSMIAAAALRWLNDGSLKVIDRSDPNNWRLVSSNRDGIS